LKTDMDDLIIRPALLTDLDRICFIERECFSVPWSREDMEYFLNESLSGGRSNCRSLFLCAVIDGALAGYVCMRCVAGEAEIMNVAVTSEYRRRGIGRRLMEYTLRESEKDSETVYLEVRVSNTAAFSMYQSLGFSSIGLRRSYYRQPTEDAIVMMRMNVRE